MKIQSAKAKGRTLQKWVCEKIAEVTGLEWGKDKPIESRPMSQSGVDVRLDREALAKFPFSVETKFQEKWNVPQWIDQAKSNTIDGTDWLLVIKRSKEKPVVIMDAEAFFKILMSNTSRENPSVYQP